MRPWGRLALGAALLGVIAVGWARLPDPTDVTERGATGGDFTLMGATGPVSLSDFEGGVVALYFGYTSCPDVCPTSLSLLGAGLSQLAPDEAAEVTGLFVSVDPARDTFPRIETYAQFFHPRIHALTGSEAALADVGARYGAAWRQVPLDGSAMGYAVDHSSTTTVIGRDGQVHTVLAHGASADRVAQALREALGPP